MSDARDTPGVSAALEIRHLRALSALDATRHFGEAAGILHVTQPTLTRTIQGLEAIVGETLVDRSRGRVALTPAGARVLRAARAALAEVDRIPALAVADPGPFRLGVMASAGWRQVRGARDAEGRIAGVPVELVGLSLLDGFDPLLAGDIDAAVSFLPLVPDERLRVRELSRAPSAAAVEEGGAIARRGTCTMDDLSEGPLLVPRHHPDWAVNFEALMRAHGLPTPPVVPVTNMFEAVCAVAGGAGLAISAGGGDFPAWPGTEVVPIVGFEDVRTGLVWTGRTPAARVAAIGDALAGAA